MPVKKKTTSRPNSRANSFISRSRLGKKNTISIQEADAIPILESRISLGERSKTRRIPIAEEFTLPKLSMLHPRVIFVNYGNASRNVIARSFLLTKDLNSCRKD